MNAEQRLEKISVWLQTFEPWWGSLYLRLKRRAAPIPTAATDGTYLFYNPKFIDSLTDDQLAVLVMHEVAHAALQHPYRRGSREPLRWNIACDAVVNAVIESAKYTLLPGGVPPAPLGKTPEEIYDEIQVIEIPIDVLSPGEGGGTGRDAGTHTMKASDWQEALRDAHGTVPESLRSVVDSALLPIVDWRAVVAQFVAQQVTRDRERTWSRRNRRFPEILPGYRKVKRRSLAVCADSSGSMTSILSRVAAEAKAVTDANDADVWLIVGDAAVAQCIEPGEPFPETFVGGGGTDFRPLLARAEELDVDGCIYITDGEGEYPEGCRIPVLWALTRQREVPFGQSVRIPTH